MLAPNAKVTAAKDVAGAVIADIDAASAETHRPGFAFAANFGTTRLPRFARPACPRVFAGSGRGPRILAERLPEASR